MRFIIERYEVYGKPCDNAYRETITIKDSRNAAAPEEVPAFKGDTSWWYSHGRNHRLEDGKITRDIERSVWLVDLDLDSLVGLIKSYGYAKISKEPSWDGLIITLGENGYE